MMSYLSRYLPWIKKNCHILREDNIEDLEISRNIYIPIQQRFRDSQIYQENPMLMRQDSCCRAGKIPWTIIFMLHAALAPCFLLLMKWALVISTLEVLTTCSIAVSVSVCGPRTGVCTGLGWDTPMFYQILDTTTLAWLLVTLAVGVFVADLMVRWRVYWV